VNSEKFFKIIKQDKKTKARIGEITTPHGKILTPSFVPVGSQATVKSLTPQDLKAIGVQAFFVNTYHLYLRPGAVVVEKLGGLHKFMNWSGPLMTDSGGFQVFSLGRVKEGAPWSVATLRKTLGKHWGKLGALSFSSLNERQLPEEKISHEGELEAGVQCSRKWPLFQVPSLVKIDYDGVTFRSHLDGSSHRFTPEKSIEIQQKLGADMIVAFDECAPYPTNHDYAEMAMKRTHRWAKRSLDYYHATACGNRVKRQFLFGVIQGSVYPDLRQQSAEFISNLPFAGLAIGGVAVGESKAQMIQVLDWVMPVLAKKEKNLRPIHLLGVGEVDDVFAAVERGIDTMDCVMPTRLGRMGQILTKGKKQKSKGKIGNQNAKFTYDITKSIFVDDPRPLDEECDCFVCRHFSRAYLNHLFRAKELLAYRLATYHNLYFTERLFAKIREALKKGEFLKLKKEYLG
jgi:tRNA-guanine transglycosylase